MHTVEEIKKEYQRLDSVTGVDTGCLEIVFSKRMSSTYGNCKCIRLPDGSYRPVKISIASFLQQEETLFWDTVRHEYAHAVSVLRTGRRPGHDKLWKDICEEVGAPKQRLAPDCAARHEKSKESPIKYSIRCEKCGRVYDRKKRSRFVAAVMKRQGKVCGYRCTCGGNIFTLLESGK